MGTLTFWTERNEDGGGGIHVWSEEGSHHQATYFKGQISFHITKIQQIRMKGKGLFTFECDNSFMQRGRLEAHNLQQSKNEHNMVLSSGFAGKILFNMCPKESRKPEPQRTGAVIQILGRRTALPLITRDILETLERNFKERKREIGFCLSALGLRPSDFEWNAQEEMTDQDGNQLLQRYYDTSNHWLFNHFHIPAEIVMIVREYIRPPPILFLDPGDLFIDVSKKFGCYDDGVTIIARRCEA